MPEVLTAREVAELIGAKTSTVYEFGRVGRLPCYRVGKLMRFRRAEVEAWMDAGGSAAPASQLQGATR